MKYRDGNKVLLGDHILSYGQSGKVVIDFDSANYSDGFTKEDWESLGCGILIRFDNGALLHLDKADHYEPNELVLINRDNNTN